MSFALARVRKPIAATTRKNLPCIQMCHPSPTPSHRTNEPRPLSTEIARRPHQRNNGAPVLPFRRPTPMSIVDDNASGLCVDVDPRHAFTVAAPLPPERPIGRKVSGSVQAVDAEPMVVVCRFVRVCAPTSAAAYSAHWSLQILPKSLGNLDRRFLTILRARQQVAAIQGIRTQPIQPLAVTHAYVGNQFRFVRAERCTPCIGGVAL